MQTLAEKIGKDSIGWYVWKMEKRNEYYKILNFNSQSGSQDYEDHFFNAEEYNEKGELKHPKVVLGLAGSQHLEVISESDLPWKK